MSNPKAINPFELPAGPRQRFAYSFGVQTERILWISGQVALNSEAQIVGVGDIATQAKQVFTNIGAILAEAGAGFDDLVETTTYMTDRAFSLPINEVRTRYITGPVPPTSTLIIVAGLAREEFLVEISATAIVPRA